MKMRGLCEVVELGFEPQTRRRSIRASLGFGTAPSAELFSAKL